MNDVRMKGYLFNTNHSHKTCHKKMIKKKKNVPRDKKTVHDSALHIIPKGKKMPVFIISTVLNHTYPNF